MHFYSPIKNGYWFMGFALICVYLVIRLLFFFILIDVSFLFASSFSLAYLKWSMSKALHILVDCQNVVGWWLVLNYVQRPPTLYFLESHGLVANVETHPTKDEGLFLEEHQLCPITMVTRGFIHSTKPCKK